MRKDMERLLRCIQNNTMKFLLRPPSTLFSFLNALLPIPLKKLFNLWGQHQRAYVLDAGSA